MTKLVKTNYNNPFYGFFDDFFTSETQRNATSMKTDILEVKDGYELHIDVPGYKKEDIKISLEKGYLTIEAKKEESKEIIDEDTKYLRRERFYGTAARSFYVGEEIIQEDIKAHYDAGILTVHVPKEGSNKPVTQYIDIL